MSSISKPSDAASAGGGNVADDDEYYMDQLAGILDSFPKSGPPKHPCRVLDHVYIGSQDNADDLDLLPALGITHVLNMAGTRNFDLTRSHYKPSVGIKAYLQYQAEDYDEYDIVQHFPDAMAFLDRAKLAGGKALVHCSLGVNRSGAVVAAYMMVSERRPLLRVASELKAKRSLVLANVGFRRQLVKYARCRGLLDPVENRPVRSPAPSSSSTSTAAGTSGTLPKQSTASLRTLEARATSFNNGSIESYWMKKNFEFDDDDGKTKTTTNGSLDDDVNRLELRGVGVEKMSFDDVKKNNGLIESNGSSRGSSDLIGEEMVVDLKRCTAKREENGGIQESGRRYCEILTNGNCTSLTQMSLSSSRRREQLLNDVDAVIGKAVRDDSTNGDAIRQKSPLPPRFDVVPTIKLTNGFHQHLSNNEFVPSDDDLDLRESRRFLPDLDNVMSRPVDGYSYSSTSSSMADFSSSSAATSTLLNSSSSSSLRKSSSPFDVTLTALADFVQPSVTPTPYDTTSTTASSTRHTSQHRRPLSAGLGLRDFEPSVDVKPISYYRQAAASDFNSYRRLQQQDDDEVSDYLLEAERRSRLNSGSSSGRSVSKLPPPSGSTSHHWSSYTTAASFKPPTSLLNTSSSSIGMKSYRSSSVPNAYSSPSSLVGSLPSSGLFSGSSSTYKSYTGGTSSSGRLAPVSGSSYGRRSATRSKLMADLCEGLDPFEFGVYESTNNGYLDDGWDADTNLSLCGRIMPTRVTAAPGNSGAYVGGYASSLLNGGAVW